MLTIAEADLARMRDQLLFDGPEVGRKVSRFWALLVLASVIAAAGVVSDSTATVIGAMIVAPLMTPIVGTVLSIVTGDGLNLLRSLGLVLSGSLAVIVIGFAVGLVVPFDVVSETSSQVAGRINPRLIDLLAALATGAVGSFAVVRADVSDTLPGVAIAISLVPPLVVVGVTLEAGLEDEALGALLLFLTNVGAILLSGLVVMALYHVRKTAIRASHETVARRPFSILVVVAFVIALVVPLAASSEKITSEALNVSAVTDIARVWAEPSGWRIVDVEAAPDGIVVHAAGGPPAPAASRLRKALNDAGRGQLDVRLVLTPEQRIDLPAASRICPANGARLPRDSSRARARN